MSSGPALSQFLQPKPSADEAVKVRCPLCRQGARLSQVTSDNGNRGRWYYICCKFIKFDDGMRSRKDQPPLLEPAGTSFAAGKPLTRHPVPPQLTTRSPVAPASQLVAGNGYRASPSEARVPAAQPSAGILVYQHQANLSSQPPMLLTQHTPTENSATVTAPGPQQAPVHMHSALAGSQNLSQLQQASNSIATSAAYQSQDALRRRQAQTAQLRKSYSLHTAAAASQPPCISTASQSHDASDPASSLSDPTTPVHIPLGAQHLMARNILHADDAMHTCNATPECMPQMEGVQDAELALIDSLYAAPPSTQAATAAPQGLGWKLGPSQGFSQVSSSHAWAATQPISATPTSQHAAAGSPVWLHNATQGQTPIMLSPPKSPPGSLAARAAALSQALQSSPQNANTQDLQGTENRFLVGDVCERSPSDDVDAMFDVLNSPAVKQKIARVQEAPQIGGTEGGAQQPPPGAAERRFSGSSSDDDAMLAVLNSPEVKRKIQQCAAAGWISAAQDGEPGSPRAMGGTGGVLGTKLDYTALKLRPNPLGLEVQVDGQAAGENGIGMANASDACVRRGGRTKADRMNAQRCKLETQGKAKDGGEGAVEAMGWNPLGAAEAGQGGEQERSFHEGGTAASAVQQKKLQSAQEDAAAVHGTGEAASAAAVETDDDDDVVVVCTQPAPQPQQQVAERAPSQVIDLC